MNTDTPERKMGRPKLPEEKARALTEKIRVNKEERAAFKRASEKAGTDRSEWMRNTLLKAAGAA